MRDHRIRLGSRGVIGVVLIGATLAAACGSPVRARATPLPVATIKPAADGAASAPPPAPQTEWTFDFNAANAGEQKVDFHVSLIGTPILIWFYSAGGSLVRVRVIGHSKDAGVCDAVSSRLEGTLFNPAVDGSFNYGITDLRPRDPIGDAEAFDRVAEALRLELDEIAHEHPDVQIRDISDPADTMFAVAPSISSTATLTYVFRDSISATQSPQLVPARTWQPDEVAKPIEFEVTAKELGLTPVLFRPFESQINLSVWKGAVTYAQEVVGEVAAYRDWYNAGAQLDSSHSGLRSTRKSAGSLRPRAAQLERWIKTADRVLAVARTLERGYRLRRLLAASLAAYPPAPFTPSEVYAALIEAERVIDTNTTCLAALRGGGASRCETYYAVEPMRSSPEMSSATSSLLRDVKSAGAQGIRDLEGIAARKLQEAEDELANARRVKALGDQSGRELLVDGLLRGWPISSGNLLIDAILQYIAEQEVPRVWTRILSEYKARGVELKASVGGVDVVGGDLVGPSMYYRVSDQGNGSFRVMPMYVVHGDFDERWSPSRRTVLITRRFE